MRTKLAGYSNKRTFSVIRFVNNRPDFTPCFMSNSIVKCEDEIKRLGASGAEGSWKLHILLDDGDWCLVTEEIYNYCNYYQNGVRA